MTSHEYLKWLIRISSKDKTEITTRHLQTLLDITQGEKVKELLGIASKLYGDVWGHIVCHDTFINNSLSGNNLTSSVVDCDPPKLDWAKDLKIYLDADE